MKDVTPNAPAIINPPFASMTVEADKMLEEDWDRPTADAQLGDANAHRTLLTGLAKWLRHRYARWLPLAMTDNAVQLLAIQEKRHTHDPARLFGPWLAAVARYKRIDRLRSLGIQAAELLGDDVGVTDHGDAVVVGFTLHRILAPLKPVQTVAIGWAKLEGYSIEKALRGARSIGGAHQVEHPPWPRAARGNG